MKDKPSSTPINVERKKPFRYDHYEPSPPGKPKTVPPVELIDSRGEPVELTPVVATATAKKSTKSSSPQERLKNAVADALDVLEDGLTAKDGGERRRIAIEILDRAGVMKPKDTSEDTSIEADQKLAQAIANAFCGSAALLGISIHSTEGRAM